MHVYSILCLVHLAALCNAGFISSAAKAAANAAKAATLANLIGKGLAKIGPEAPKMFGLAESGIWFGQYVIVDGKLYYGAGVAAAGGAAAAGAGAGIGAAAVSALGTEYGGEYRTKSGL